MRRDGGLLYAVACQYTPRKDIKTMKRKLLCGLLAALVLSAGTVRAAPSGRVVAVQVDGTMLRTGVSYLDKGVTYVPLRGLLDAFGGWSVWWDSGERTAEAASDSHRVSADPAADRTSSSRKGIGRCVLMYPETPADSSYIPISAVNIPYSDVSMEPCSSRAGESTNI